MIETTKEEIGTLKAGEPHPSSRFAMDYVLGFPRIELVVLLEALSSCAISGNRLAEVCSETLRRVLNHEPVSDRYLLGLAFYMKEKEKVDANPT